MKRLTRYFVAGVFAILPLVITVVAITWAIGFMAGLVGPDTFLGNILRSIGLRFVTDQTGAYVLGWIGIIAATFVLGFLVESGLRGLITRVTNGIINRLPLVGKVYDTSKQLVGMLDQQGDDKLKGMSVVYCSFGEKGGAGVLALLPTPEAVPIKGRNYNVVLVPQSPVPIGGGLLFVPVESVERVAMSVEKFMSIYVSMGVTAPELMRSNRGLPEILDGESNASG